MEQARLEQLKRDVIGLSQRSNRNPNYNYVSDNQKPDVLEEPLKDMNTDNSILPDFSSVNPLNELKKTNAYKHMFYSKADVLEEARKINKATGIPENAMLTSPENMDKAREIYEEREKQLDINAVYKMYPGLEKLATMDETAAAIALHDLKNVKTTHGIIEAAKTGWYMDELQHERNELGRKKYQQGISIAEEKRIKEIEEELRNSKQIPDLLDKPLEAVIGGVSQQLPMMARNFLEGQLLGIAGGILGAGVGAAAGSLGGAAGIAAGATQGARYGYSLGARAGYGAAMFDDVVGGYYLDYLNYKDKNGQQLLTDEQAMSYATVTAVIESGIEMANIGKVIDILKGSARTAGAASGLREIIRGAQDTASMRAQLKNWLKDNSKAFGFIAITESAEEGVQEAASMGITNVAAYNNPTGNIPMYSAGEIAQGGLNAAAEALPAALGFGGMAVAGRGAGIIRDIAALNEIGQTEINGRLKNIAGVNMLEKLVMDCKSNKLAQEHPETYEALVKQTLAGSQFNNIYVDTLSLSEDKEGTKILNQLLSQTSISAEQAESIKESKDDLVMHTADYLKFITNNEELREKLYKYISFDAAANSFARNKTLAEKLKKDMDSILAGEAERTIANIDNLVNETFTNEDERELAKYLIFQYDDTKKAVQEFIKEQNAQLEEMYAPIIKEMEGGMKQGVAKYYDEETGKWLRASNNAAWYSNYFAENNKAPGKNEMRDIARDILLGKNEYGLDGYDLRNEAAQEWIENNKVQIEQIEAQIELAKKIDEKLQNIKKEDLAMMESLTESGVKVYKKLYELFRTADNKSLKTAAGMNALLFAYRSERFADAMRRSGKKDYKAEDYLARFNFVFDGNGNGLKQENIIDKGNFYTVNLTGNEFGKFADLKDLRSKAVAWYRDNLQGTTAYNEYLGKVRIGKGMTQNDLAFSSIGRKKMSHTSAKEEKLLSVMYLKELIENANFITESDGSKEKHEGEHFYYLHTKLHDAQNNELYLIVNVKEDMYGRLMYYNHNIFNADEYKKIEDAYTENPEPWISSPGVDNQKASSFTNSITGKGRVYKQQGIVFNQTAYHGTPHSFEQFDLGAIGSGAGAQMHGWGLYFAKNKSTAKKYQKALEEKGIKGQTFQVDIPDNKYLLDEQKSFKEQAKNIQKLIVKAIENLSQEQQKKFFEEILGNKLSESRATIDAKKILSDNESIVRALDGLINPPKSKAPIAFLKRIRLETLNRVGYSNEQIEQMSQSPEMVEAEKAKYSEAITEAQNRLKEAQASDEIKNAEKLLQAVSNPAEALQSNIYTGEKIYTAFRYALSGKDYNSRLASEYLNKQGIKGITYDDYKDGRCFVVFDDAAIGVINRFNQAAGINARTANFERLEEAKKLEKSNASRDEIYYKTGWYKGGDGKWRFDIPDFLPRYGISKFEIPVENETMLQGTLAEIYPNHDLFKAYPALKEVEVYVVNNDESYYGYAGSNYIVLNAKSLGYFKNAASKDEASKTLIHEVQHIIQNYEEFAKGGTEKTVRKLISKQIKFLQEKAQGFNTDIQKWWELDQKAEEAFFSDESEELSNQLQNEADTFAQKNNISKKQQSEYRDIAYQIERLENALKEKDDFKLYHNLYGEVEARSASSKAELNDEIRKAQDEAVKYRYQARDAYIDLPEKLQKIADDYKSINEYIHNLDNNTQNEESYFEKSYDLAEQLNTDEAGMRYVSAMEDMYWSLENVHELEKQYVAEIMSSSADTLNKIYVYKKDLKNYSQSPTPNYIKGQAQINSNGSRIIYLYKYADQSTFIHEMAHVFFDDTRELASLADAPDQIKKDYETLVKWAEWQEGQVEEYKNSAFYNEFMTRNALIHKAQANGGFVVRKDSDGNTQNVSLEELLYEWQQERFARGFEHYIASGQAPNTALRGVFSRFARWLAKIYRSIKNMGEQPSEEVRAVMDRMIASQEEIDLAAKKAELEGFEKAGGFKYLTDSAENMWLNIIDEIKQSAEANILKVAMYDLKVEAKKEREEKVKREREAARERISQEPVFIIQKAQQSNPKLNIEQAAQQLGNMTLNEYIAKLKEYGGSLDNAVEQYMAEYEKELDKNIADEKQLKEKAEAAVHSNKYKKMLTAYEYAAIERAIAKDVRLNKQLGKESKEDKNVETIVRMRSRVNRFIEKYTKRMNEQSDVFNKLKKGQRGLRDAAKGNVKLIDEYAERKVALMPLTEAAVPALWHKKSKDAAELVNSNIVKNDWDSALKYKKYQLVYDSVAVLAEQNKEFLKKQVTKLNNRYKTILRSKNMDANDRYLYNHLLYVFGIIPNDVAKPSTYGTLQDVLISYDKNLELQFVDEDGALNLPDWFMNAATAEGRRENGFTDLTIGQFKDFIKIMDNLYTVAINEKKLKKITDEDGESILVENAVAEINSSIMARRSVMVDNDPTKAGTVTNKERALKIAEKAYIKTVRPETIIEEMGEPAERYLFNALSSAANKELDMTKELQNELSAIMAAYKQGKSEVYKNTGKSSKEAESLAKKDMENLHSQKNYKLGTSLLTKENVLSIALNWGTDINRKRVMDGFKVSAGEVNRLLGSLDSADWQFVINIWDLFDKYWQDIVDVEARITGVVLEKQEARDFTIIAADGTVYTIKGGYYPLKYDPMKNTDIQQKLADESKRISMSGTTRLGIGLGTTKERSSGRVEYKLKTELSVISDTISENIHMIAMREAVRDVNKIINNVEFANTVKAYFGEAAYKMLQNWVLDCWAAEPKTKSPFEYLMQKVRHGQTAAVLGFRMTTALLNINNISPMMDYIGVFNTVDAVKHFYKHPREHYELVMDKSIILRDRAETMDRDMAEIVRGTGKAASVYNDVQKMAFWFITKTDLMLACPLWLHEYERVYQKLIHENKMPLDKIESKAVEAGDKAVRKIFGSNRTVDMAEVQRGSEIEKMLTMYYSYFSVVHNAMISKGYDYARNKKNGKLKAIVPIAKGILFWYIVPAVMEAAFRALISDSEDEPEDIAYKAGANVVNTAVGGLPIIRDVVPMVLRLALDGQYYGMSNSPLNEGIDQIIKTFNAVKSDKKDVYDVARESLRSIDMFTGISMTLTDALVTSLEWLDKGEQNTDDILHYLWAILFAKDPEKNKNVNYKKL